MEDARYYSYNIADMNARERELEDENYKLKAEVGYLKVLLKFLPRIY
jgi:hypothetical protein